MRSAAVVILWFVSLIIVQKVNAQTVISNFDELITFANAKSLTIKGGNIQFAQANKAKLAAILGIADPTGNISATYTNNTKLPVSLFPSEIFGGQSGTFKEVKLGVQYQTNINAYIDVKLINLQGWEALRLSKINMQVVESQNKITLKSLHENMAVIYYSIITLQEQLKSTKQNLLVADTLYKITLLKYEQGLAKQQDVNDSKVNYLNIEESHRQIEYHIQQQTLALKLVCDIPETESIQIIQTISEEKINIHPSIEANSLLVNNSLYSLMFAQSNYRKSLYSNLPTFSIFASTTTQQYNTQSRLFDNNVNWIPSNYIGIKLSIPIPSSNSVNQFSKAKYDYMLAKNNTEQSKIRADLNQKQLQNDFDKSLSQFRSNKEVFALRRDTYQKNLINYNSGIISLEQTINSFNAMVSSEYNLIASAISVVLSETKININNKIR